MNSMRSTANGQPVANRIYGAIPPWISRDVMSSEAIKVADPVLRNLKRITEEP